MLLGLTWLILSYAFIALAEQHCQDRTNCPIYPLQGCFATEEGLICKSRNFRGFELSVNPLELFIYSPYPSIENDTGMPCVTIPLSDELYSYVDYRGPEVIEEADLQYIGNCTRQSYCDKVTKTCQPKRPVGAACHNNMECYYGPTYFPGRCANHSVCAVNDDLPPYAYGATLHQWTLGDQWRSAIWAVLLTGAVATCLLVGRQQARKMVTGVHNLIEKWQNRPSPLPEQEPFVEEDAGGARQENVPQRRWWARIPGTGWIHRKLRRSQDQGAYYQLATRNAGAEEPPPYRE